MSVSGRVRIFSLTYAEDHWVNAQQVNAREIARRLDPARFEITLLSDGSGPASIAQAPAVALLRLPRRRKSVTILRRLLGGAQDLVFTPGPGRPEAIHLALPRWAPGRRARVLLPVEGDLAQLDEVEPALRRRVDRLLRRADALFPVTSFVAETLRARTGRDGEVVPVGVDLEAFRPREGARAPGPLRVLCVGTVKGWKRPEWARAAARALPDVEFTWIGEGEALASERAAAPGNLAFVGACAREALPARVRAHDVLLHPGRREGLPKVVLEAMASGLPVVAAKEWRPDFLVEAGAGIVVDGVEGAVTALASLREDHARRTAMGAAARRCAEGFGWDAIAARWAAVFEREARRE